MLTKTATVARRTCTDHSAEDHDVWDTLCEKSLSHMYQWPIDPRFGTNIRSLGLLDGGVPSLKKINQRLLAATGWTMYPATGRESQEEVLVRFAKREHPILTTLRPMSQIDRADNPDMWHDAWGHGWMLYDGTFAKIYEAMGRQAELVAGTHRFLWLVSLHNKLHEFGLQIQDGVATPRGAAIYSSTEEMRNAFTNPDVLRIRFDPACPSDVRRAMRTKFFYDKLQRGYYVLSGDETDLLALLESNLEPYYAELEGVPLLEPGEQCETDFYIAL